jgi:hypothetical protein
LDCRAGERSRRYCTRYFGVGSVRLFRKARVVQRFIFENVAEREGCLQFTV